MRRRLGCGRLAGQGLVGARRASAPQRLALLPVLTQLPALFFQHLTALAQALAEQVDDLHPRRPVDGHGQRPGGGVQRDGYEAFQFEREQLVLLGAGAWPLQAADAKSNLDSLLGASAKSDGFLPPDVAFRLAASAAGPDRVQLSWAIAPGYYLYQARLKFATASPGITLGKPELPAGDTKNDEYFGKQIVYHNGLVAQLRVARAAGAGNSLALAVTYQGCAEAGLCYPPITKQFTLALTAAADAPGASAARPVPTSFRPQRSAPSCPLTTRKFPAPVQPPHS